MDLKGRVFPPISRIFTREHGSDPVTASTLACAADALPGHGNRIIVKSDRSAGDPPWGTATAKIREEGHDSGIPPLAATDDDFRHEHSHRCVPSSARHAGGLCGNRRV